MTTDEGKAQVRAVDKKLGILLLHLAGAGAERWFVRYHASASAVRHERFVLTRIRAALRAPLRLLQSKNPG